MTRHLPVLILVALAAGATACTNKTPEDTAPACGGAVANAGTDVTVPVGSAAALDGTASTTCGADAIFTWSFDSVPVESAVTAAMLSDNGTATATAPQFTPDVVGDYVLSLVITEGSVDSAADVVVVTATDSGNLPPVADCGVDVTVQVGHRAVLDASDSYDPEGVAVEYYWALSTVPDGSSLEGDDLFNTGGPNPAMVPDVVGTYLVSLVVSDGEAWSEADFCSVTATSENQAPVADAGTGGALPPCTESVIELNAYGSYDPEGEAISYLWSLVSAPAGSACDDSSFDDPTRPDALFTWDLPGAYTFELRVNDGEFDSAPDIVTYTIASRSENTSPVANAGSDQTVEGTASCSSSSYVWTCDDCPAESTYLDGTASSDPDGDEVNFYWSEPTSELTIHTPYGGYTEVTTPPVAASVSTTVYSTWTVYLDVSDCEASASDSVVVTYACEGTPY